MSLHNNVKTDNPLFCCADMDGIFQEQIKNPKNSLFVLVIL